MMAITTRSSINVNPRRFRTIVVLSVLRLVLSVRRDAQAFGTLLIAHDIFHGIKGDEIFSLDALDLLVAISTFTRAPERRRRRCGRISAFRPAADRGKDWQQDQERHGQQSPPLAFHSTHAVHLVARESNDRPQLAKRVPGGKRAEYPSIAAFLAL